MCVLGCQHLYGQYTLNKSIFASPLRTLHVACFLLDKTEPRRHASSFVQWIRTWTNLTFAKGLSRERNSDEKAKLLEEFFERLADQVAIAPADRGHHRVDQFVTIAKTGEV